MPRRPRLTQRFLRNRRALGVKPGTPAGLAVAAAIGRILAAEVLPGPGDTRSLIPPTGWAYTRRVVGRNLWLWFVPRDGEVSFKALTAVPPLPADDEEPPESH